MVSKTTSSTEELLSAPMVITTHINADFDAVASIIAAKKLYPSALLVFPGTQERALRNFFFGGEKPLYDFKYPHEIDMATVTTLVVVDARQKNRIPHMKDALLNKNLKIYIYDHHPASSEDLIATSEVIRPWGATTTIIVHELMAQNIPVTQIEATIFGLGIYEDTGSFTFPSTSPFDYQAAEWLCRQGMDFGTISKFISKTLTPEQIEVLNSLLESTQIHIIKGVKVAIAETSKEEFLCDFALIVQKVMEATEAQVIFALANMADKVQIVARSKSEKINVGKICLSFGGGGHALAASASVKDIPRAQIKENILTLLRTSAIQEITVQQLMSTPAVTISKETSVQEAGNTMARYGLKAIPVVEPKTMQCVGLLEYQLAVRAVNHGLGAIPVQEYMQRKVLTVDPSSDLYTVTRIILEEHQRLIPVISDNKIVGVITRTDLINILVEAPARIPESMASENRKYRNIAPLMQERLPAKTLEYLYAAGDYGDKIKVNIYAVGGFVRDILMNRPNLDLDMVVEGDALAFANGLANKLGAKIRFHHPFKTAQLVIPEANGQEQHLDIATARLEYYDHPGALPTVELSSIKMDLYRRDFTINAVAVQLNKDHFGRFLDFFGAMRDLKDHMIRVLHSLSFVEDPTRILRAVRFEQRFEFQLGHQTERLIKNAIQLRLLQKVSDGRMMHEFKNILMEEDAVACLERLEALGILAAIHPALHLTPRKQDILYEVRKIIDWYGLLYLSPLPNVCHLYLLCLCVHSKYLEASAIIKKLGFPDSIRKEFLNLREQTRMMEKKLHDRFKTDLSRSELYELLFPLQLESLLFIMADTENEDIKKDISFFLTKLRDIKADINGNDVMSLGVPQGPQIGKLLRNVLNAKIDGRVKGRQEQLEFLKNLIRC